MLNSLVNPTFIQYLKSSINRDHSGDNELKVCEMSQCKKMIAALHFLQASLTSFLIIIVVILLLKIPGLAIIYRKDLKIDYRSMLVTFKKMKLAT